MKEEYFLLYTLVRRRKKWLVIPAMLGGAALLADGMITPPISVTSAVEGLRQISAFSTITTSEIVGIVIGIITLLFFLQQFGTASIGRLFGPMMSIWFVMLAVLGCMHLFDDIGVFKAFSPHYAIGSVKIGWWTRLLDIRRRISFALPELRHYILIWGIAENGISATPGYL